jgi:hypothetical protein
LEQADDMTVGFDLDVPVRTHCFGDATGARNHCLRRRGGPAASLLDGCVMIHLGAFKLETADATIATVWIISRAGSGPQNEKRV